MLRRLGCVIAVVVSLFGFNNEFAGTAAAWAPPSSNIKQTEAIGTCGAGPFQELQIDVLTNGAAFIAFESTFLTSSDPGQHRVDVPSPSQVARLESTCGLTGLQFIEISVAPAPSGCGNFACATNHTVILEATENASITRFRFTLTLTGAAGLEPVPNVDKSLVPSESDNLNSQQRTFTSLVLNQQSYDMTSGVSSNVNKLLTGNGAAPSINENGFFVSSAGLGSWLKSQEMELRNEEAKAYGFAAPLGA